MVFDRNHSNNGHAYSLREKPKIKGAIKWHGGKTYLAPWILSHTPPHTRYCEAFFGGGAVLFAKDGEGVAEFVNDCSRELTSFWDVLKDDELYSRFMRRVSCTPFSELEWELAVNTDRPDKVDAASAFFIRYRQSRQGLGRDFATPTRRLRRGMNENVSAWLSAVDGLPEAHNPPVPVHSGAPVIDGEETSVQTTLNGFDRIIQPKKRQAQSSHNRLVEPFAVTRPPARRRVKPLAGQMELF